MQAAGDFLWVKEELTPADIIYVLGGDYESRIPHAAALYEQGLAKKIVVPRESMIREDHFTDTSMSMLREAGVPESGMQEWKVGRGVGTTADEMAALKLYTEVFPNVRKVLIVTSAYHTRRARYTAKRFLWLKGVDIEISGVEKPGDWKMQGWWLVGRGRDQVWDEYKKLFYYGPRYILGF